jgi:hypothetical protein
MLTPKRRKELEEALKDTTIVGRVIQIVLSEWVESRFVPNRNALDRHRRGDCRCPR